MSVPTPKSKFRKFPSWNDDVTVLVSLATDGCDDVDISAPVLEIEKVVPKLTLYQMSNYAF